MKLSNQFISTLKLSNKPAWRLAVEAGLRPDQLTKFVRGWYTPKGENIRRLERIGLSLGLARDEVFEEEPKSCQ